MNFNQLINQVLGAAKQYGDKAAQSDTLTKLGGGAAEAYLAARLVCADLSRKEIVFLSQLSQALQLDDKLVDSLEKQAGF